MQSARIATPDQDLLQGGPAGRGAMAAGSSVTYRFGDFSLDTGTRRLLSGQQEVHVSPKAFELLSLLVENRRQAMSKADLQQKLWPETYVAEANLAGLVVELRRALGDSAEAPRYIRTMHRFGYWFIAEVEGDSARDATAKPRVKYWLLWDTRQIALQQGENVIGRASDAGIWIDAPGVSRHHARIVLEGTDAVLEDLGSKNGTYVKGRRVAAPLRLADGDQIRLGTVVVTFRIPPPAGSTETARP